MRSSRKVLAVVVVLLAVAPLAQAGHAGASCAAAREVVTPVTQAGCVMSVACPAGGPPCLWALGLSATATGQIIAGISTPATTLASCGPAIGGCATGAPFNLPPGGSATIACGMAGSPVGLLASLTCSATPAGHVG